MFSTGIYDSWQIIQNEKFKGIKRHLGTLEKEIFDKRLVLDIGCGFGYFERFFDGNFIGVDKDIDMLRKHAEIFPIVLGDGNHLPFKDSSFDTVVCIDTMHFIENNDFMRVLKTGGFAIMSIFYNDDNYEERKKTLQEKSSSLTMLTDFEIQGKEKEYVIVAVKH